MTSFGLKKSELKQGLHRSNTSSTALKTGRSFWNRASEKKRTHRLCNLGGTVESLAPVFKDLSRTEMTGLLEHIFALPEVEQALREAAAAHERNLHREEETDNGIVPLHSRPGETQ